MSYSPTRSEFGLSPRATLARALAERLLALFQRIFANTPDLIREAYRLRYQVYCVEHPYEDPARNPDGLERDEYDHHSLHGILRHRASGTTIGTMRWVLHKAGGGARSFPLYEACRDARMRANDFLPLEKTAELSRFAISKKFRRRAGDSAYHEAHHTREFDARQETPNIALQLMAVAFQIAVSHGVEYGLAAMEPTLLRLLRRFAMKFEPLGPLVQYHGWRQPCYAHIPSLMAVVERERPEIWGIMTESGQVWSSSHGSPGSAFRPVPMPVEAGRIRDHRHLREGEATALPAVA